MSRTNPLLSTALFLLGSAFFASHAQAADEVKLLSNLNVPMIRYSISWQNSQTKILVKNLAYEKKVTVVFTKGEQTVEAPASYVGPAEDGYELWVSHSNVPDEDGFTFHVTYDVKGETYVAKNADQDFPLLDGPVLYDGQSIQQVHTGLEYWGNAATVTAALRSDGSGKKAARLHYSFDDFKTTQESSFELVSVYYYGYGSVQSPGSGNSEIWQAQVSGIPADRSTFKYYLTTEIDGVMQRDDNFGRYYSMSRAKN